MEAILDRLVKEDLHGKETPEQKPEWGKQVRPADTEGEAAVGLASAKALRQGCAW